MPIFAWLWYTGLHAALLHGYPISAGQWPYAIVSCESDVGLVRRAIGLIYYLILSKGRLMRPGHAWLYLWLGYTQRCASRAH